MACYHPLAAWRTAGGSILWRDTGKGSPLSIPCGRCIGCRIAKSQEWALRCVHEAKTSTGGEFITLTYADEHVPPGFSLRPDDWRLFMRRVRKIYPDARYFMCGEYGEHNYRPHFHSCLFNVQLPDRQKFGTSDSGAQLYVSKVLQKLWPYGHSTTGDITLQSAAYVARYVIKKITGDLADERYTRLGPDGLVYRVEPEYARMSTHPGIGHAYFLRYARSDILHRDGLLQPGGATKRMPKYYDKLTRRYFGAATLDELKDWREQRASTMDPNETSPARLAVRETVAAAGLAFKLRTL